MKNTSQFPLPTHILPILLVVIVSALAIPILYTYAQNQSTTTAAPVPATTAGSLSESINAIAVLIGVIAPLIISLLAYLKAKTQDPKIQKAIDDGINIGRVTTAMANKTVENKQHIKEALEVGIALAPEDAKKVLEANKAKIDQLNMEINATRAQISRLVPMIPGEANADTIADLPREPASAAPRRAPPS